MVGKGVGVAVLPKSEMMGMRVIGKNDSCAKPSCFCSVSRAVIKMPISNVKMTLPVNMRLVGHLPLRVSATAGS